MDDINLNYSNLRTIKKEKLKKKITDWDTKRWQQEIAEKSSLYIYRNWKTVGSEEKIYDNRPSSVILFKARTNNLRLKDRNRHTDGDTKCIFCDWTLENLTHFLLCCPGYSEIRQKSKVFQRPYIENEDNIIGQLLFNETNIQETKEIVYEMWKKREKQLDTTV